MRGLLLFLLTVVVIMLITGAFYVGHIKYPSNAPADVAKSAGLTFGVLSAIFWGLSAISNPFFNSWFNFFAAGFAAVSLGYLT